MADITINAAASCDTNGLGVITGTWSAANVQDATVTILGDNTQYNATATFLAASSGAFTFNHLPNDIYEVYITGNGTPTGTFANKYAVVNCVPEESGGGGSVGGSCNVGILGVTITPGDGESATTATVNGYGASSLEYSLNNGAFQSSNVFTVTPGTYIATVRSVTNTDCSAATSFVVSEPNALSVTGPARDWLPVGQPIYYTFQSPDAEPLPLEINIEVSLNGVNFNGTTSAGTVILPPDTNGQYRVNVAPYLEAMFEPGPPAMAGTDYKLFRLYRLQAGLLTTPDARALYAKESSPMLAGVMVLSREPYAFNSTSFTGLKTAVDVAANSIANTPATYAGGLDLCPKYPIQLYWLNRFGGWQTWVFDGKHEQVQDIPTPSEWMDENNRVHRAGFEGIAETVQVYSGFIPLAAFDTVFGILSAIRVYSRERGIWREVNIDTGSYLRDKKGQRRKELNFAFTYAETLSTQRA